MSDRNLFNTDEEYRTQLMKELIDIVGELGWNILLPELEDDELVPGMIIGEPDYVEAILDELEKAVVNGRS